MMSRDSLRERIGPSRYVALLMILALLLTVVLAINAIETTRSHRRTAERVLRDYAAFAAEQYASRLNRVLTAVAFDQPVYRLSIRGISDRARELPSPDELPVDSTRRRGLAPEALSLVAATFRLDPERRELEFSGGPLPETVRMWIRDTVPADMTRSIEEDWPYAVLFQLSEAYFAVYEVASDAGDGSVAGGFIGRTGDLAPFLELADAYGPLLPSSLTGGVSSDSLAGVRLTLPDGGELHSTAWFSEVGIKGSDTLLSRLGGLRVTTSLSPEAAPRLIIGGLPSDRVPLTIALLLLTSGLVVAALLVLHREAELARLRADFVSGVSHELRTPLAQIRMFAETLMLGRVRSDSEHHRSLRIIDHETRRLTHLVENLLHFSRSERGVTRISPETVDLGSLVAATVEGFTPLARTRDVDLTVRARQGVRASVDRAALEQVVINLLDNAVKYGPQGQTVTVTVREVGGWAEIAVRDEGPGVPERHREKIWERFWRPDRQGDSASTGTGIGLALVRELVSLHDGEVSVENASPGARFVVRIPAEKEARPAPDASQSRTPETVG